MTWDDFKNLASFVGVPGAMMAVALIALHRGWFVTRRELDAALKDRDEWKARCLELWPLVERLESTTAQAVTHAQSVTEKKKRE